MIRQLFVAALTLTCALVATPSTSSHARRTELIAHRGASLDAPENTVTAARLAWAQKADAVETDIRLTKDGELIVLHDATTTRIDGRNMPVSELTLAEIRALDLGRALSQAYGSEKVPLLDEMIATIPDGKRLFVEIKTGPEILPALERTLARTHVPEESIVLIGFNYDVLRQAHERWPGYKTLWLVGFHGSVSIEHVIEKAIAAGFSGLDLASNWPLDAQAVWKIRSAGLQLHVWTIDDPDAAKQWIELGVDGVTTNRAGWMREQLSI